MYTLIRWYEMIGGLFPVCRSVREKQVTVITIRWLLCGTTTACLLSGFVWSWSVLQALQRSGLFVSSSATNQSGDLPWLFCQLKLFSTVESCGVLSKRFNFENKRQAESNMLTSTSHHLQLLQESYSFYFQERSSCCSRIWAPCKATVEHVGCL